MPRMQYGERRTLRVSVRLTRPGLDDGLRREDYAAFVAVRPEWESIDHTSSSWAQAVVRQGGDSTELIVQHTIGEGLDIDPPRGSHSIWVRLVPAPESGMPDVPLRKIRERLVVV